MLSITQCTRLSSMIAINDRYLNGSIPSSDAGYWFVGVVLVGDTRKRSKRNRSSKCSFNLPFAFNNRLRNRLLSYNHAMPTIKLRLSFSVHFLSSLAKNQFRRHALQAKDFAENNNVNLSRNKKPRKAHNFLPTTNTSRKIVHCQANTTLLA